MRIIVGSDQAGFPLKQAVIEYLSATGRELVDAGTHSAHEAVDYPDYARTICLAVDAGEYERGILICGTGLGMSIAANRFAGVRASLCHDAFTAHLGRAHNNANVLCMGAWVVTPQQAEGILEEWLKTDFEEGRHTSRVAKLAHQTPEFSASVPPLTEILGTLGLQFGVALSPRRSSFGPLLFAGRLPEGLQAAAHAGFRVLDLSLRSPDDLPSGELASLLDQHGLTIAAIATGQACLHDSLCLGDRDPKVQQAAVDRLESFVKLAAEFKTRVIVGGIRGRLSGSQLDQDRSRSAAIEGLRHCANLAGSQGVTLLVEPINRYETNFINTVEDGLRLLEEVAAPGMKLLLDTFHMNIEEPNLPSALRTAGGLLGELHIADSNRHAPGQGHIDFAGVFRTLIEIRFAGPVVAEILPVPNDLAALQQTAEFLGPTIDGGRRGTTAT